MSTAPTPSIPHRMLRGMLHDARDHPGSAPPFILHALDLMHVYDIDCALLGTPSWPSAVKKAVRLRAVALWRAALDNMPRLRAMYPADAQLSVAAYLRIPAFRGRHLLIMYWREAGGPGPCHLLYIG